MTAADTYDLAMPDAPENWMTRADAARLLEVSTQTVDRITDIRRWKNQRTREVWLFAADVQKVKAEREAAPKLEP